MHAHLTAGNVIQRPDPAFFLLSSLPAVCLAPCITFLQSPPSQGPERLLLTDSVCNRQEQCSRVLCQGGRPQELGF